jgi:hypothetical protein
MYSWGICSGPEDPNSDYYQWPIISQVLENGCDSGDDPEEAEKKLATSTLTFCWVCKPGSAFGRFTVAASFDWRARW